MKRHLLSTRRVVPLDRLDDYFAAWQLVRAATETAGGRAWLYRGTNRQDHFIEFLEWGEEPTPRRPDLGPVHAARLELDQHFGHGQTDDWDEVALEESPEESPE